MSYHVRPRQSAPAPPPQPANQPQPAQPPLPATWTANTPATLDDVAAVLRTIAWLLTFILFTVGYIAWDLHAYVQATTVH